MDGVSRLIEAAKRLEMLDVANDDNSCFMCGGSAYKHWEECPHLATPRIVEALQLTAALLGHIYDPEYANDTLHHSDEVRRLAELTL